MEMVNLVTSPFGLGEKLILELLKRQESVYTVFPSPKDVPMSFLGKINLKYGFVRFDQDQNITKGLPRKVKNVFHIYELYNGSFPRLFKANTLATLLLLDWARNVGVKHFIYLSSGEVYGQGENLTEKSPHNPRNFYATTKFEAEFFLKFYYKYFKIITIRIFFPYGRTLEQGFVSELHHAVMSKEVIETEYNVISPTFIDDAIEPLIKARNLDKSDVFNISGSPVSTEELIDQLKSVCRSSARKTKIGQTALTGSSARAEKILGYRRTPLNDALKISFGK